MKKLILMAAIVAGALCVQGEVVSLYCYSYGGYRWTFRNPFYNNQVELYSTSDCAARQPCPSGAYSVPKTVGRYTVTKIGNYAFAECGQLTKVTLPSTVWAIDYHAFYNCRQLSEMTIPTTVTSIGGAAFAGCSKSFSVRFTSWDHWRSVSYDDGCNGLLASPSDITLFVEGKAVTRLADLPENVRSVPNYAFSGYGKFVFDTIPSSVTNIGKGAFAHCPNVTNVVLSRGDVHLEPDLFHWSSIKDIRFSGGMRDVPNGVCRYCGGLTNVTFESAVTNIGPKAFEDCDNLQEIVLPSSVETIGERAFADCRKLRAVTLPPTLKSLPAGIFSWCWSLPAIDIPKTVTSIGAGAFSYCLELASVTLPPNLTEIPANAFYDNSKLKTVSIPDGVTSIGPSAFCDCNNLTMAVIPSAVTNIGSSAFELTGLTEVTLPSNLVSIGTKAFSCRKLVTVRVRGSKPTGYGLFSNAPTNLVTYVERYDSSWDSVLEQGMWCDRKIVCSNDWTITFDLGDKGERTGGGALVQTAYTGGSVTAPTVVVTNEDYVFDGWDKSLEDIPFRRTINAVYEPKPMAIKGASEFSVRRFDDGVAVQLAAYGGVKPYVWTAVSGLPDGMTVSTNGVISGNTAFLGTTTVEIQITDSRGVGETLSYTLTVKENPNAKPVLDSRTPSADPAVIAHGGERTFSVTARDPEGEPLAYRWFVDGVERTDATNAVFAYREPEDGVTNREIRCVVEDPVWKVGYTLETAWSVRTLFDPVIVSAEGDLFTTGSGQVFVTCNIAAAELFVAVGLAPRLIDKFRYAAPVTLEKSATVWAVARCGDQVSSYVSRRFTVATPALSDPVGAGPRVQFTTGGDADWEPDGASLRSGAVGPGEESWLEATFSGTGTFRFSWKTDCEHDTDGICSWDALEVLVDGASDRYDAIDGTGAWEGVSIGFSRKGTHTIRWRFSRDDYDEPDADFANSGWISAVSWSETPLPELGGDASAAKVAEVIAAAADARLKAHVTTAERYGRFRTWALGVDAAGEGWNVLAHSRAWVSFALAQPSLLAHGLTDEDLKVKSFVPAATGSGAFTLTTAIGDLAVGATADPSDLAELIGISGSATLDTTSFSSENVSATFAAPVEDGIPVVVKPKIAAPAFFFRLQFR